MEPVVRVSDLSRSFQVIDRAPGLRAALGSVFRRSFRTIEAISGVSFEVAPGEIVGFLGPNGAGKTTTLKCVAGLLTPTGGRVDVLGFEPSKRSSDFLRQIGFVMGQRWQLHIDLPIADSFELHRAVYGLGRAEFAESRDELVDLLDLGPLLTQQARQLSLGQRMRCEFAAALLHRPRVILLDEPTLGLDFDAQRTIRSFVQHYARDKRAAVLLTSHYLIDVEELSDRVMTISSGRITFSGRFEDLRALAGGRKRMTARLRSPIQDLRDLQSLGAIVRHTDALLILDVEREKSGAVLSALQRRPEVADVSVADPPVEETLTDLYSGDRG